MVGKIFQKGKSIFTGAQDSILSAAFVIMLMIIVSQILGVIRQRILLHFFSPSEYALFLAAFRLPDLVFEVFAFGAFSAAFIPVFSRALKKGEGQAWDIAGRVVNIGLLIFAPCALFFGFFAEGFYSFVTPGFSKEQTAIIASLARVLFAAQGIFVISYTLTGVLESLRRFLVPSIAPIFYNLGIIIGTLLLGPRFGLWAPAIGVFIGASLHLFIQLPLAIRLGFRFSRSLKPTPDVKKIGRLAVPRVAELSFLQILKTLELSLASIISTASYTYLTLANSLALVPISLFGVSLAKAALPTLTQEEDNQKFKRIFLSTLYQMMFFTIPLATFLAVLRIPIVRLVFGTGIFDWEATVQTGLTLTAFAVGIPFQASLALVSRAFYARHDTRTPVALSIFDVFLTIILQIIFVTSFHLPVWSIALAGTISGIVQLSVLFTLLSKKLNNGNLFSLIPIFKITLASLASGGAMFFLLKLFDRSVWVKKLSFLKDIDAQSPLIFERFVLDTRYTVNLFILTAIVAIIGGVVFLTLSFLLKSHELAVLISTLQKRAFKLGKSPDPIQEAN